MRYEKDVEQIETDSEKIKEIVEEYRRLIARLDEEYNKTDGSGRLLLYELERQMKKLVEYIFEKENRAKNEIGGAIMGGTVMKTIDEEIEELKNEIKESKREIEENQRALKEKEDTIKEKEDTIKEKEDMLKEKEAALAEAMAEIERLKKQ